MPPLHSSRDRDLFYAAAVVGLRALDARERSPRRFGPDADARWEQFKGALGVGDRLDLLLRDAAGAWGSAFSPALAFGAFGLAQDEPFGPDWQSISDDRARRLLAETGAELADAAKALSISPSAVTLPAINPSTHLVVAGGAALLALGQRFASRADLAWSEQVVVVAVSPVARQFAGLVAVILGAQRRTTVVRAAEDHGATLRAAGFPQVDTAVVSDDADADSARFARAAASRA